ncbi:sensor histidine kinase [Geodermatophilus sp. DSM 44513]|uniref:sensor histidine kinase n=1 Tax=Geodermatophilus sp. DSM 44513 TaxID=1528104 RepID=UPI001412E937|nr:sensor histidine kinase [Geodermatophilus sp. DSM 44513]WNV76834.1 sensor histidine kinase [Geodermatophilus sp. DSM 44513]
MGPDLLHDAVLHDSAQELAAVAAPFLLDALACGDGAVVAVRPATANVLREALADDPLVQVHEHRYLYRPRTSAAITAFHRLGEQASPGRRIRVVGEVDFGTTAAECHEWQRFEAAINHVFAASPLWRLCLFDTQRLPDVVLTTARSTHPHLLTAAGRAVNHDYVDPATYLSGLAAPEEPVERTPPELTADDVVDLIALRRTVRAHLDTVAGPPDLVEDYLLAVDEMVSNATRHGRRPVGLRLWTPPGRLVCTIRDAGTGPTDPFAGYGPAHGEDLSHGGMGLWLARQLCDHVAISRDDQGSTVRLSTSWA